MAKKKSLWARPVSWQLGLVLVLLVGVPLSLSALINFQGVTGKARDEQAVKENWLPLPNTSAYELTVIGAPNERVAPVPRAGWILMPLNRGVTVTAREGDAFLVDDANGFDGLTQLSLPKRGSLAENDAAEFEVYVRWLQPPSGGQQLLCGTEEAATYWCRNGARVILGNGDTQDLTDRVRMVTMITEGSGEQSPYFVFDERLQDQVWQYDNQGIRIAHIRLYPVN